MKTYKFPRNCHITGVILYGVYTFDDEGALRYSTTYHSETLGMDGVE